MHGRGRGDEGDPWTTMYSIDTESGGFDKSMWPEIMKEINWKAPSTCLGCDDWRERTFTHKARGKTGGLAV